jgi:endonuclease G
MIEAKRLLETDEPIREEILELVSSNRNLPIAEQYHVSPQMLERVVREGGLPDEEKGTRPWTEAVITRYMRPVLLVRNNRFQIPESLELRKRLLPTRSLIEHYLPSVGRIEFRFHPSKRWGGTGWMIANGVIVTNRHVAEEFALRTNGKISFQKNFTGKSMEAWIDFREEFIESGVQIESFEIPIKEIKFLEEHDRGKPDVAFLLLEEHKFLPEPIPIKPAKIDENSFIVVVGYPARDPRGVVDAHEAYELFGDIYDVKRLSPGQIMIVEDDAWYFTHNATTLGGNSGSVILDVNSGQAVGMHFQGHLREANHAIKGNTLLEYLDNKVGIKIMIPKRPPEPQILFEDEEFEEATPDEYINREGYKPDFLAEDSNEFPEENPGFYLPLPNTDSIENDVLTFDFQGSTMDLLKYTHFSVKMSKKRRLCVFSAVNIDGKQTKRRKRTNWRLDPRIPIEAQIIKECYGLEPKFSRGHMTRRNDPIWGKDADADIGNQDSMHVTNAVPQLQPFNAGIWLGLEDYALENADQDEMRISVFTGPVLSDNDPTHFNIQIPVEFWKIIVFIHDETRKLCATGYLMSQEEFIRYEEFVYGAYKTFQVPIATIEKKSKLSFRKLIDIDPFHVFDEGPVSPLEDFTQIRFTSH